MITRIKSGRIIIRVKVRKKLLYCLYLNQISSSEKGGKRIISLRAIPGDRFFIEPPSLGDFKRWLLQAVQVPIVYALTLFKFKVDVFGFVTWRLLRVTMSWWRPCIAVSRVASAQSAEA
jgi:hypothetical protein